jgi:hypothetical protein
MRTEQCRVLADQILKDLHDIVRTQYPTHSGEAKKRRTK